MAGREFVVDPRYAILASRVLRPEPSGGPAPASDARRGFVDGGTQPCGECRGHGAVGGVVGDHDWDDDAYACNRCNEAGVVLRPATVRSQPRPHEAVALAADPRGIERAEACARAFAEGLRDWGAPARERIVWRFGGPFAREFDVPPVLRQIGNWLTFSALDGCWRAAVEAFDPTHFDPRRLGQGPVLPCPVHEQARRRAQDICSKHAAWVNAAARELELPARVAAGIWRFELPDHPFAGRRFADLPNPYEPLLELWLTGYALDALDGDALMLVGPPA